MESKRSRVVLSLACVAAAGALAIARGGAAERAQPSRPEPPKVEGAWTGTWGPYAPGRESAGKQLSARQAQLDCKIEKLSARKYRATFEGECGRPYKYTIRMLGRPSGKAVLFQGTADLGPQDGGVYDWIGRATDSEFVGFYTSEGHVGTFRLERPR